MTSPAVEAFVSALPTYPGDRPAGGWWQWIASEIDRGAPTFHRSIDHIRFRTQGIVSMSI